MECEGEYEVEVGSFCTRFSMDKEECNATESIDLLKKLSSLNYEGRQLIRGPGIYVVRLKMYKIKSDSFPKKSGEMFHILSF